MQKRVDERETALRGMHICSMLLAMMLKDEEKTHLVRQWSTSQRRQHGKNVVNGRRDDLGKKKISMISATKTQREQSCCLRWRCPRPITQMMCRKTLT